MSAAIGTFIIAVLVCVVLALLLDRLARLYTMRGGFRSETANLLGSLIAVYGILTSLVVVAAWNHYRDARSLSEKEISDAINIYNALELLPPPLSDQGTLQVIAYIDTLIDYEWPAMEEGRLSAETSIAIRTLWRTIGTYESETPREVQLQRSALTALNELGTDRRLRVVAAMRSLPGEMWAIVIIGGLLALGLSPLLGIRNRRARILRLGTATIIGLIVATIFSFERPFMRPARLNPEGLVLVRNLMIGRWRMAHPTADMPGAATADRSAAESSARSK